MPTQELGPHNWYIDNLPAELSSEVIKNWDFTNDNPLSTPMSLVSTLIVCDIQQAEYLINLRTGLVFIQRFARYYRFCKISNTHLSKPFKSINH